LFRLSSLNVWLKNNQPQQLVKDVLPRMLTFELLLLSRCISVFTEHPVLALASCIPAELVSFLKGKSNVAIFQDVCKLFILYI